jgi:hypothetical protein
MHCDDVRSLNAFLNRIFANAVTVLPVLASPSAIETVKISRLEIQTLGLQLI